MPSAVRQLTGAWRHVYASAVGFSGGTCVGLVGWGGAQFIIPGMTHPLMGLSQLAATGVSLCSLSCSTVTSAASFIANDSVSISTAAAIAIPSIASARIGARWAARMPDDVLQLAFNAASVILIPTHFLVQRNAAHRLECTVNPNVPPHAEAARSQQAKQVQLEQQQQQQQQQRELQQPQHQQPEPELQPYHGDSALSLTHGAFGCISGIISAIMGVGGLPLTMSYLTAFTALPHHIVQGTAILSVAPSAITSALSRASVIPPATAVAVSCGAMCGASLGASIALRTSEDRLRGLYMLSLVILGGRSVVGATRNLASIWARRTRHRG